MKPPLHIPGLVASLLVLILLAALFLVVPCHAQDAAPSITSAPSSEIPQDLQGFLLGVFLKFSATHAWLATAFVVMGALRAAAKPLSSLVHLMVDLTPTNMDNRLLASAMDFFVNNYFGRSLAYLIDWLTSIKIVPPRS